MKNLRSLRLIVISLFALLTASCGDFDGGPLVRPGDATGRLVIENRSQYTLTAVLLSRCNNFTHGFNRLPSNTAIQPGQSYSFTLSTGCWDVMAGRGDSSQTNIANSKVHVEPGRIHVLGIR